MMEKIILFSLIDHNSPEFQPIFFWHYQKLKLAFSTYITTCTQHQLSSPASKEKKSRSKKPTTNSVENGRCLNTNLPRRYNVDLLGTATNDAIIFT